MADEELTDRRREAIQRWFDGELDEPLRSEIEELIESNDAARAYLDRLREVRSAVGAADEELSSAAEPLPSVEAIAEAAEAAAPPERQPLAELAPLIERYYDGEALEAERRAVERALEEREEAREYLEALEQLGAAARGANRQLLDGVDFEAFRDRLESDLADERRGIENLHRYVDGELSEEERRRVEERLEDDHRAVEAVAALEELRGAVRGADKEARARAELDDLWSGVEARLDELEGDEVEGPETVVELAGAEPEAPAAPERSERRGDGTDRTDGSVIDLFAEYRPHLTGAAAAAVVLLAVAALLRPTLVQKSEKTVVIVDSVEQRAGSSVVVDGPMRRIGGRAGSSGGGAASDEQGAESSEGSKGGKPTVIWLLESEPGSDRDGDSQQGGEEPASNDEPADDAPDAGTRPEGPDRVDDERDASPERSGQPI